MGTALKVSILLAVLVLTSSYALAHNGVTHTDGDTSHNKVDATCVQTAVETRETALISGWGDFNETITTALGERKTALKAAWGLTDKKAQKTAIAGAWKEWKKDSKSAHVEMKKDRKSAWDAFKKTVKETCKVTAPKEESLEKDSAGSIAL